MLQIISKINYLTVILITTNQSLLVFTNTNTTQEVRSENLEGMMRHSCNAWKAYNEHLDEQREDALSELQQVKGRVKEVNWQRKNLHVKTGEQLDLLESKWVELISKNYEIEEAILKLEREIAAKEAAQSKEEE